MTKSVLIIDDEKVVVDIVKRKLDELGYLAFTATNGEIGLKLLKEKHPDLVLLDIEMPVMNGYTFLLQKNKDPDFAEIPVITITAYAETEAVFKKHKVSAYLLKPLKLNELLDKVVEAVGPSA